jgi:thiamine biosynthesis lipoprotein
MQMRIILNGSVGTVKRLRIALGTLVAIEATAASTSAAEAAVEAAYCAIKSIDDRMHPSGTRSDLARINRASPGIPLAVHPTISQLLNLARRINALSEGVFDPCLPSQPGKLQDIVAICPEEVICRMPVALDFGGFAKGYAVDRAITTLMERGCTNGLVNAGGDLRVFGSGLDPIFVRGPSGDLTNIDLKGAALAVSDANSQTRPPEHRGYYNRVHGAASPLANFAAVIAPEAVIADALSKCVLLCPADVAARALSEFGATQTLTT